MRAHAHSGSVMALPRLHKTAPETAALLLHMNLPPCCIALMRPLPCNAGGRSTLETSTAAAATVGEFHMRLVINESPVAQSGSGG